MNDIRVIHRFALIKLNILIVSGTRRSVLGEAGSWPGDALAGPDYASSPSLLIFQDREKMRRIDPGSIIRVELHGPRGWMKPCEEASNLDELKDDFDMKVERRGRGCSLGAEAKGDRGDWNALLTALLAFSLLEGRPVRSFKTTFLFPFTLRSSERGDAVECGLAVRHVRRMQVQNEDAATVLFFLPHIRDILFGGASKTDGASHESMERVQRWEMDEDHRKFKLRITRESDSMVLDLSDLGLFFFPNNNVYFLTFAATFQNPCDIGWDGVEKPLDLFDFMARENGWEKIRNAQTGDCLAVNNLARIIYPSHEEMADEKKIARVELIDAREDGVVALFNEISPVGSMSDDLRANLSPVVDYLIKAFLNVGDLRILPMLDDRMFVNTHIVPWGEKPVSKAGKDACQTLFSLALYVDLTGWRELGGYAYDPEFVKRRLDDNVLRRWEALSGNLYGFTDYSNVYFGFGGFFAEKIAGHVHAMYFYMTLLALYCRVSMHDYSAKLARAAKELLENPGKKASRDNVEKLRASFIKFTNVYWYHEVTSQIQGMEIFDLQRRALNLDRSYEEIKDELEHVNDHIRMVWQEKVSHTANTLALVGLFLAAASVFSGLSGKSMEFQLLFSSIVLMAFCAYIAIRKN